MNKFDIPDWIQEFYQSKKNRVIVLEKCGEKAFLDPKELKYPIVNPKTCKPDFTLIHAAYVRAKQYHKNSIATKAKALLKEFEK